MRPRDHLLDEAEVARSVGIPLLQHVPVRISTCESHAIEQINHGANISVMMACSALQLISTQRETVCSRRTKRGIENHLRRRRQASRGAAAPTAAQQIAALESSVWFASPKSTRRGKRSMRRKNRPESFTRRRGDSPLCSGCGLADGAPTLASVLQAASSEMR